jgi:hypothetical protein
MSNEKSSFSVPGMNGLMESLSKIDRLPDFKMPVITPVSVQQAQSFQKGIANVIDELQAGLAQDEELFVYYSNGVESIRVLHLYMSSTNVAVISGVDAEGNATRVVAHFQALQFVCKVVKVSAEKSKVKIGFAFER